MDYLELFNGLGKRVKPSAAAFRPTASLEALLEDSGLDSLDAIMLSVYTCEIFAIPEAVGKQLNPKRWTDIVTFVEQHKVRDVASAADAFALID